MANCDRKRVADRRLDLIEEMMEVSNAILLGEELWDRYYALLNELTEPEQDG
ncbi:hypothetical protein LX81_03989 [Palleronia aestuarii]|uniref:Uncharacterized protein n=1 Tax=Palleronia aestuarii TaxID=568105 RepID=A0A2W7MYU4_9RHOB|nr:hypothetical protein [Palleronia aestuarii]PZX11317.1 hypothetical protein LX81_03989 [Palleronia aestuarii]